MKDKEYRKGVFLAIIAYFFYGLGGITAKYSMSGGAGSVVLILLRNTVALPLLFAYIKIRGMSLKINSRQLLFISTAGILVSCATPVLIYSAYDYISVGLTICIHYVYPVIIALAEFFIFGQKLSRRKILAMAFAIGGIWLIMFSASALSLKGIIYALLSSLGFAAYIIFIARTGLKSLPGPVCAFYCTAASSVAMLAFCLVKGEDFLHPGSETMFWSVITALLVVCLGNAIIPEAIKRAGSATASILGILEPITTTAVSVLLLKEAMTARSFLGGLLVLFSAALILTDKNPRAEED
ncbi:MAG TPA: DMT family transporter [Bacillota bacterium]|nr:DMT family transporter [Bacillota bacterium]HQC35755.1 DMT family transporter [Bacillota bacterium]